MAAVCLPLPQRLFGPDPHGFHAAHDARTATNLAWLQAWLRGCAARGVSIEGVTHHELRPIIPDTWPESLRELLKQCWASSAAERPSFAAVVHMLEEGRIDFPCEAVENELFKNSIMSALPF